MASNQFADGKSKLIEPFHGAYPDQWDEPLNNNFMVIDALVSGTTEIAVASIVSSAPYKTLVFDEYSATTPDPLANPLAGQNLRILITGALAFNITIFIPTGTPGLWLVDNQTSGVFTVSVKTTASGSVGITAKQGYCSTIFCDGVNVKFADEGTIQANYPPVATDTVNGLVKQGALVGNCLVLQQYQSDTNGKTPPSTDKIIISTSAPDPAQGDQNWLWYKTV